jgi:hypothetical protein
MKSVVTIIVAVSMLIILPLNAEAVCKPKAIDWTNPSDEAFVRSLYLGVFCREPKTDEVVWSWSREVTGLDSSRLKVFNWFVESEEYQLRNPKGIEGPYTLWTNSCPSTPSERYVISTDYPESGSWNPHGEDKWIMNYAIAVMEYRTALIPFKICR